MRWDPTAYLRFAAERSRPFADLMARVPAEDPRLVVDLGCGPGNLTATLAARWPAARVHGLDSAPEMIDRATALTVDGADLDGGRLTFGVGDLRTWRAADLGAVGAEGVDLLVSNATLQWVPDHLDLLPQLVAQVCLGGWLAVQLPGNVAARTHTAMTELAATPRWAGHFAGRDPAHVRVAEPLGYLARLAGLGCRVDAWETTYLHVLDGDDAVVDWVSGTALRPYLEALEEERLRAEFVADYRALVAAAYPRHPWGTVLPFRRIFVVAHRVA